MKKKKEAKCRNWYYQSLSSMNLNTVYLCSKVINESILCLIVIHIALPGKVLHRIHTTASTVISACQHNSQQSRIYMNTCTRSQRTNQAAHLICDKNDNFTFRDPAIFLNTPKATQVDSVKCYLSGILVSTISWSLTLQWPLCHVG